MGLNVAAPYSEFMCVGCLIQNDHANNEIVMYPVPTMRLCCIHVPLIVWIPYNNDEIVGIQHFTLPCVGYLYTG